jgi:hypothetical protein
MAAETAEKTLYVSLDVPRSNFRLCPSMPSLNGGPEFFVRFVGVLYVADTAFESGNSVDILEECFDNSELP